MACSRRHKPETWSQMGGTQMRLSVKRWPWWRVAGTAAGQTAPADTQSPGNLEPNESQGGSLSLAEKAELTRELPLCAVTAKKRDYKFPHLRSAVRVQEDRDGCPEMSRVGPFSTHSGSIITPCTQMPDWAGIGGNSCLDGPNFSTASLKPGEYLSTGQSGTAGHLLSSSERQDS